MKKILNTLKKKDKILHSMVGAIIAPIGFVFANLMNYNLLALFFGASLVLMVSIARELYNLYSSRAGFNLMDIFATTLGGIISLTLLMFYSGDAYVLG